MAVRWPHHNVAGQYVCGRGIACGLIVRLMLLCADGLGTCVLGAHAAWIGCAVMLVLLVLWARDGIALIVQPILQPTA
ncbi:hypothetical protein JB92DRAFT_1703758 [Gautieria morchelliformis]|nr:hypothetical protein JB92DRAFT_1703758 [Gautieria morchelliformis]